MPSLPAEQAPASGPDDRVVVRPARGNDRVRDAAAHESARRALAIAERTEGRRIPWGVGGRLTIVPRAIIGRSALNIGTENGYDPRTRRVELVQVPGRLDMAEDNDVTAHESGHALLAVLKPALASVGGEAMSEAFGDLYAVFAACDDDALLQRAIADGLGDSNALSRIGERFARAQHEEGGPARGAIRDLARPFSVSDVAAKAISQRRMGNLLDRLNFDASNTIDLHHTAQLVAGPFYRVFAERASVALADGGDRLAAVRHVRDDVAALLHDTLVFMREDGGTLRDVQAAAVYAARRRDANGGGRWEATTRAAFVASGFPAEVDTPWSVRSLPPLRIPPGGDLMRSVAVRTLVRSWGVAPEAVQVAHDYRNTNGDRIVRFKAGPAWIGGLVLDAQGRLIAASPAH